MQGFTERQLEQLREEMKSAMIQFFNIPSRLLSERVPENVQKPECEPGHYESNNSKFKWDGLETDSLDFIDWLENEYPQLKVLGFVTDCKSNELTKVEHDGFSYEINAKKGDWLYKKDGRIFIEHQTKISEHLCNNGRFKCCCEVCDCGEPKLKDEVSIADTFQCFNCGEFNSVGDEMCTYCGIYF